MAGRRIVQVGRRRPAGYPPTEAIAPLAQRMALVKHLLRVVGREATLARQGQLRVVGLGFQLGDQVMQRLGTLLVQRCIMRQQAGQRILPVGGNGPRQTGAQEAVQGRGNSSPAGCGSGSILNAKGTPSDVGGREFRRGVSPAGFECIA